MQRNINKLQNQLVYFTEALSKKKGSKNNLDEGNSLLHDEFIIKLKVTPLYKALKYVRIRLTEILARRIGNSQSRNRDRRHRKRH